LPGYGYAKVSQSSRSSWEKFIRAYLLKRENLQCVFVLIDSRIEPQKIDLDFCLWLGENGIPFILVFTKADKQSALKTQENVQKFGKALLQYFEELPQQFITSSENKLGREELLEFIDEVNKNYNK